DANVFLLTKTKAKAAKTGNAKLVEEVGKNDLTTRSEQEAEEGDITPETEVKLDKGPQTKTLRLVGTISRELWNRLGHKLLPKLGSGNDLNLAIDFSATFKADVAQKMEADLRQALQDLGLQDKVQIEKN